MADEIKEILVTEDNKFQLQRYSFELRNAIDNATFMLSHHLKDKTDEYITSKSWEKMIIDIVTARIEFSKHQEKIIISMLKTRPYMFSFEDNFNFLEYKL